MVRVNVINDLGLDYLLDEPTDKQRKIALSKYHNKNIKISDELFEHMFKEGLVKKTKDGYVFVGTYDELKACTKE